MIYTIVIGLYPFQFIRIEFYNYQSYKISVQHHRLTSELWQLNSNSIIICNMNISVQHQTFPFYSNHQMLLISSFVIWKCQYKTVWVCPLIWLRNPQEIKILKMKISVQHYRATASTLWHLNCTNIGHSKMEISVHSVLHMFIFCTWMED